MNKYHGKRFRQGAEDPGAEVPFGHWQVPFDNWVLLPQYQSAGSILGSLEGGQGP